jgi:hypothetical protein
MEGCAVSFLVWRIFRLWLHYRQLSKCLHSPHAAWAKRRLTTVALSTLQILHSMVFEHPARDVAVSARQVRELSFADFAPLFPG